MVELIFALVVSFIISWGMLQFVTMRHQPSIEPPEQRTAEKSDL